MIRVLPAYGRDYKNRKDLLADWDAGKDFIIYVGPDEGRYVNIEDARGETIHFRYAAKTKIHIHGEKK